MTTEIYIPSTLSDITLEQYQLLMKVQDKDDSEEVQARKLISIFCKIPFSQVLKIKYNSIQEIVLRLQQMFSEPHGMVTRFKLGKQEFGFITSLEDISWEEHIDAESYLASWETFHNAMAVLYRPIIETKRDKYEIEPYESSINYAEVMKAMPLDVALGANVFFWNLGSELLIGLVEFLENELTTKEKAILAKQLNLISGGGGINQYIQLQKEALRSLTKLPHYHLLSV
jgi:hypothetical protein